MRTSLLAVAAVAMVLWVSAGCAQHGGGPATSTEGGVTLSGPYTHENLSIYLIHAPDRADGGGPVYLTLTEALEQKKVVVHETGNVNELAVENVSPDQEVYIQSGDIVKGGRQDRTLSYDLVLAPKSGKVELAAFCVEHGRWQQRGTESAGNFGSSYTAVSGNHMKLAAKSGDATSQPAVWAEVARQQGNMTANSGMRVESTTSPSSYQLTLENSKVQELTDAYVKTLQPAAEGQGDVVGYAVAVNGKVTSIDAYGSGALFRKLWPKLLRSTAVEAFGEYQKDKQFPTPSAADVRAVMSAAEKGQASQKQINPRTLMKQYEATDSIYFETIDQAQPAAPIHKNYLTRPAEPQSSARPGHIAPRENYSGGHVQWRSSTQPSTRPGRSGQNVLYNGGNGGNVNVGGGDDIYLIPIDDEPATQPATQPATRPATRP